MMKMDKENLAKNQFWLLLGAAGTLSLVALVVLLLGPSGKIAAARENYTKFLGTVDPAKNNNYKNPRFLPKWNEREEFYRSHKNRVWEQAFLTQKDLMTWPRRMVEEAPSLAFAHFGEPIDKHIRQGRLLYQERYYLTQFGLMQHGKFVFSRQKFLAPNSTDEWVWFPVDFDEQRLFAPYTFKLPPTDEECWLAQEELWLRREVLNTLREALDTIGRFQEVREPVFDLGLKGTGGPAIDAAVRHTGKLQPKLYVERTIPAEVRKDGVEKSRLFRNRDWEVEIFLKKHPEVPGKWVVSGKSRIWNINPTRRPLPLVNNFGGEGKGLFIRIRQGRVTAELPEIHGVLMPWSDNSVARDEDGNYPNGKYEEFGASFQRQVNSTTYTPSSIDLSRDFELEQAYWPGNSPIKVITELRIGRGALSERVAAEYDLVKGRISPEEDPAAATQPAGGGGTTPPGGMTTPGGGMMAPGGLMAPGGAAGVPIDGTPNGIPRKRYVLSNEVVRRIPIAFRIVMDQSYRNELLAAVANSRLRIQITQVYWNHRRQPLGGQARPGEGPADAPRDYGVPPAFGGYGTGAIEGPSDAGGEAPPGDGGLQGLPTPPTFPGGVAPPNMPGGRFPGGAAPADTHSEINRNLIELSLHGIASLYERYPPPKPAEGAGTQPGATTPAGQ